MKKRFLAAVLALCLVFSLAAPATALESEDCGQLECDEAVSESVTVSEPGADEAPAPEDDGIVETEGDSAGAPPERFNIYVQAGDSDPMLLKSYTGADMRAMAKLYNPDCTNLKFSSVSGSGIAGRITTEYITITDLLNEASDGDEPVSFGSGDYLIMGEDFTKDQNYIDAGYSRAQLMGNWYSYDGVVGAERYYFPNWSSASNADAVEVPAVIGIRSYGASNGLNDKLLGLYANSADYLWAYVLYFGQKDCTEVTYSSFYYGQTQAIIRYDGDAPLNGTISDLLDDELIRAHELLDSTVTANSADEVAQGKFWVTKAQYDDLSYALKTANTEKAAESAENGAVYDALLALSKQCDAFEAARQSGAREGYLWYTDNRTDTYIINTAQQLIELGKIVSGSAVDPGTQLSIDQDSFNGKTVLLACDIDLEGYRVNIGNSKHPFEGTFDGQGCTIKNLRMTYSNRDYVGLFGNIGTNGTVKSFTVRGAASVESGWSYVGGVAAKNSGTIEGVRCSVDVTVSGSGESGSYVGGISGYNDGTVRDCAYTGSIVRGGDFAVGGIAGYNRGTVTGCIAENGMSGTNASCIVGCISTKAPLTTVNSGSIKSSYTISGKAAESGSGTFENVYCLAASSTETGVTALAEPASFESEAVLAALNAYGGFKSVTGGYPCLIWQTVYSVSFDLILTGNTMDMVQVGEYLPIICPADPKPMKTGDDGVSVADTEKRFAEWCSDEERQQAFDFDTLCSGDITLYAKWIDSSTGAPIYVLRINETRYTASGVKTSTKTYFHAEGSSYSHSVEDYSGYIAETETVSGQMGSSDCEISVHYYHLGDVNMDGIVNAIDAMLTLRAAAKLVEFTDIQNRIADADESEDLSSDDAVLILRYAIGMKDSL